MMMKELEGVSPEILEIDFSTLDEVGLRTMIDGRTDAEIDAYALYRGVDALLAPCFTVMSAVFDPRKSKGENVVTQYHLLTPDGPREWTLTMDGATCTAAPGRASDPRLELELALPDFLRLISGQANSMALVARRKLHVKGNLLFAKKTEGWFTRMA